MELGLRRAQIFLAFVMGDYRLCANLSLEFADEILQRLTAQAANIRVRFNAAMSGLIMAQMGKRKYKRLGLKNAAVVRSWTKKGNVNCLHLETLLDAEQARLESKANSAIKSYESAIVLSGRRGFIHDQALACERYADFLFSLGHKADGTSRLQDAIKWYEEWGASAKVHQLGSRSPTT